MTVQQLRDKLNEYIVMGHANTDVIATCDFVITHQEGSKYYKDFPFMCLNRVAYQSGDIELSFSEE